MATTLLTEVPRFPVTCIYDPGGSPAIHEEGDTESSLVARAPSFVTVSQLPAGTTASIMVKLSPDGSYISVKDLTDADGPDLYFAGGANFVKVVRTAGAGDFVVEVQD